MTTTQQSKFGQAATERCQASVHTVPSYGKPRRCFRKGCIKEKGKLWCKQHAPSAVEARRDAREEKYWSEDRRIRALRAKTDAKDKIVEAAMAWFHADEGERPLEQALEIAIGDYEKLLEDGQ